MIDHISHTSIDTWLRCPRQWRYRYLDGIKIPPPGAIILGRAYHKGLEINFEQKIISKKNLPLDDILDAFRTSFDDYINQEGEVNWEGEKPDRMVDEGVEITRIYITHHARKIQPVSVEEKFSLDGFCEIPLVGKVDLITEDNRIIDHKITKRRKTLNDIDIQSLAYSIAYPGRRFEYHIGIRTKKPQVQRLEVNVKTQDQEFYKEIAKEVIKAIKSGIFPPNPNGWHCSKKFCGYYDICRERSRKRTLVEKSLEEIEKIEI